MSPEWEGPGKRERRRKGGKVGEGGREISGGSRGGIQGCKGTPLLQPNALMASVDYRADAQERSAVLESLLLGKHASAVTYAATPS